MKLLVIALSIIWSIGSTTQPDENSVVRAENFNADLLERLLHEELNFKRKYHGKSALNFNPIMYQPAKHHVWAMVENNFFSHSNPHSIELKNLDDRMKATGLKLNGWAENILYCDYYGLHGQPYYEKEIRGERVIVNAQTDRVMKPLTYRELAIAMIDQWMGSSGHRKNMLYPDFNEAAVAVAIDEKDGLPQVFAVLVFGII